MLKSHRIKIWGRINVCVILFLSGFINWHGVNEFENSIQAPVPINSSVSTGLSSPESIFLDKLARDTWNYLKSDWATDNHLPWSWRSLTITGGDYTNPAEIGLYALSWLAAYDLQRTWSPSWAATETEVYTILDQLRAWQTGSQTQQPYGPNAYNNKVFYQWYWINNSPPVVGPNSGDNHLVPSVDNAWLAASLITIREYAEVNNHPVLVQKADAILDDMDFTMWYHYDTHRFSWGDIENPQGGTQADYYSNENRIINFVARALGQLSAAEFKQSLLVLNKPSGIYNGITIEDLSWDGSYFTYTSPALFIREMDTSYGWNTIIPATHAQVEYAQDQGYSVWGLSDNFDMGIGGYIQQGAPPAAMPGSPETQPGLVSPHASAMALITPLEPIAISNLEKIASSFTCYDPTYGFRDSVMAKPGTNYGKCSDRFSALAQEWIFLSIVNHEKGFIWNYLYRNSGVGAAHSEMYGPSWTMVWSDEFNGTGSIDSSKWICDIGTKYSGGPDQWGTGEVQSYSCSTDNVFQSEGSLNIRALHTGTNPLTNWTSGRIESVYTDFQPSPNGVMAVEARIKIPDVNNSNGMGYWPAFWMVGAPFRGNYWNWPSIGEIDIMENVNGLNQWWSVFHCGTNPDGPCNEPTGIAKNVSGFIPSLQSAFHTYRVELDRNTYPQEIRWYVDGIPHHTVYSNQVDIATWNYATNHGFIILLNLAIGGGFPNGNAGFTTPTTSTISGGTMLVDFVRVFQGPISISGNAGVAGATLSFVDGTLKTVTSNGSGGYSFTVPYGWSGTVTPSLGGSTFCPASKTYSDLTANQPAQNYAPAACAQYNPLSLWTTDFSYFPQGWRADLHPRVMGDVNGDGRDDILGFGYGGVLVGLSNGTGFDSATRWTEDFSYNQGWRMDTYPRMVGDVNGDGRDDIVGFGYAGAVVALSNGSSFDALSLWTTDFSYFPQGWRADLHPRVMGDVNGDGRDDIVGFGYGGVLVALSNGSSFDPVTRWTTDFSYNQGWRMDTYPRMVGDVNGDDKADIVGFGYAGAVVALSNGSSFDPLSLWTTDFSYYPQGWRADLHPRVTGDANGDGKDDIFGFGYGGVLVGLSNGVGIGLVSNVTTDFSYNQGWRMDTYPRMVGDVNGDGKADIVGFGYAGAVVATAK